MTQLWLVTMRHVLRDVIDDMKAQQQDFRTPLSALRLIAIWRPKLEGILALIPPQGPVKPPKEPVNVRPDKT